MKIDKSFFMEKDGRISFDKHIAGEDYHLNIDVHKSETNWILTIHVKGKNVGKKLETIHITPYTPPLIIGNIQPILQKKGVRYFNLPECLIDNPVHRIDPRSPELIYLLEEVSLLQLQVTDESLFIKKLADLDHITVEPN